MPLSSDHRQNLRIALELFQNGSGCCCGTCLNPNPNPNPKNNHFLAHYAAKIYDFEGCSQEEEIVENEHMSAFTAS